MPAYNETCPGNRSERMHRTLASLCVVALLVLAGCGGPGPAADTTAPPADGGDVSSPIATPTDEMGTPTDETSTPTDETSTPENGTATPGDGTSTPENGTATPGDGTGTGTPTPTDEGA